MSDQQEQESGTTPTPKKVKFVNQKHKRQKYYGSGLTNDHNTAYTEVLINDDTAFTDTKNQELQSFFASLQAGDIVGVIGDLLVVPENYKFDPNKSTVALNEFTGGTVKKPVVSKHSDTIEWKDNMDLGIYYRAGFVEHLYRDAVATDGGDAMEIDEQELIEQLKRSIKNNNPQQAATSTPAATAEEQPAVSGA